MSCSKSSPSPQRAKRVQSHLLIAKFQGDITRLTLSRNTDRHGLGFQEKVLANKDEESAYFKKFMGYKHTETIVDGVRTYSCYSYQYKGNASPQGLQDILQQCEWALYKFEDGVTPGNIKVQVDVAEGVKSMDFFYSDADIINHCVHEGKLWLYDPNELEEFRWTRAVKWDEHFSWATKDHDFFFADPDHTSIADMVAAYTERERQAPVAQNGETL